MDKIRKVRVGQVRCDGSSYNVEDYYVVINLLYGRLYRIKRLRDNSECSWYSHEIVKDAVIM